MINILRFNVYIPSSLEDALEFLKREGVEAAPMAGGTDLLVLMRDGVKRPRKVLDLWPLRRELAFVKRGDGWVRIGALTTIEELNASGLARDRRYLGFMDAYKQFGAPYLRAIATVGGNIGTAHPLSDVVILLLALDAEVRLVSVDGERWVPLSKLFRGKRETVLTPTELITEVRFKETPKGSSTVLLKFDRRWGHSMGYVIVGAYMHLDGGRIADVRLAFDSMGEPYPGRAFKTEDFLKGKEFRSEVISEACSNVLPREMRRIDDYRASAEYRLDLSKVLMKRALLKIKSRIEGGEAYGGS
ncbi:MAG: molybdopterin dehydrogenase [Desulfurococcales archaeon ex4484_204]|nr:MAG: molybdopterin dehydrogenase [Desulfurococcales archaeon ex4484_204]